MIDPICGMTVEADSPRRFTFDRGRVEAHVRRFVEMKRGRDAGQLEQRLRDLYRAARQRDNSHPAMIIRLSSVLVSWSDLAAPGNRG